jgi:hypothetical protein
VKVIKYHDAAEEVCRHLFVFSICPGAQPQPHSNFRTDPVQKDADELGSPEYLVQERHVKISNNPPEIK